MKISHAGNIWYFILQFISLKCGKDTQDMTVKVSTVEK